MKPCARFTLLLLTLLLTSVLFAPKVKGQVSITSVSPATACIGDTIVVKGFFWDASPSNMLFIIGGDTIPDSLYIDYFETFSLTNPDSVALVIPDSANRYFGSSGSCAFTIRVEDASTNAQSSIAIGACANASFSYPSPTYCPGVNATPIILGDSGITAVAQAGITYSNQVNGVIDVGASTPGTYTIQYAVNDSCPDTLSTSITLRGVPNASFSVPFNICDDTSLVHLTVPGAEYDTFFVLTVGLTITPDSGIITPSSSSPGTYDLVHSINFGPGCVDADTQQVKITNRDIATLDYGTGNLTAVQFCQNGTDTLPASFSPPGGTFFSPSGVAVNSTTGLVDLDGGATGNTLGVSYRTSGSCPDTAVVPFDIIASTTPTLTYGASSYCSDGNDPTPSVFPTGGTFGQILIPPTPGGNTLDIKNDGRLDLSKCDAGDYYVTYTTGNATCPQTDSFMVSVQDSFPATFAYPDTIFCASEDSITVSFLATINGSFRDTTGLLSSFDPITGKITPSAGDVGTHIIEYNTGFSACPDTAYFTLQIVTDNTLTLDYGTGTICEGDTATLVPTVNIAGGEFFEFSNTVVFLDSLGNIDRDSTPPGTYTIGYTVTYPCQDTALDVVTILPKSDPTFVYDQSSYCLNDTNPIPTIIGTGGGNFYEQTGTVIMNSTTGEILLGQSSSGSYFIEYAAPSPCPDSAVFAITLVDADDANFSYPAQAYCKSEPDPSPNLVTPPQNGTFSELTNSISFADAAGTIDLGSSPPGTYIIEYQTAGACPNVGSDTVTIRVTDTAIVSYPSASFCLNAPNPVPQILGTGGGVFTSNNAGAFPVVDSTGQILLSQATPGGPYIISYTTQGQCRDTVNTSLTVLATSDPNFNFADTLCLGDPIRIHTPSSITDSVGFFFETTGGLGIVNDTFATVNLDSTIAGIYTLYHRTQGACPDTVGRTLVIFPDRNPNFTYADTVFCSADTIQFPTILGDSGGVFTSVPSGLDLNPTTGAINPPLSVLGNIYTITYTTPDPCSESATWTVRIDEQIADFSIPDSLCLNQGQSTVTPTGPFTSGGVFSEPTGLLSINPTTGVINLNNSQPGTYNVTYTTGGSCALVDRDTLTLISSVSAAFTYPQSIYCTYDNDPFPVITGTTGGTFSISPSGATIIPQSGRVDIANSNTGSYTVTYVVPGPCPDTVSVPLNIRAPENANFSYPVDTVCVTDPIGTLIPTPITGGGLYSIFPASGQSFFNNSTGVINLNNAVGREGTYLITYTTQGANGCPNDSSLLITIRPQDVAAFTYPQAAICQGDFDPTPTPTGTSQGTYDQLAGPGTLNINPTTGRVDLDQSVTGIHTIRFITSGICPDTSTFDLEILPQGDARFEFPLSEYCRTGAIIPQATLLGDNNGVFSVQDTNFTVTFSNNNLGIIDLGNSNAGLNIPITHAVPGPNGGCPDTFSVTINIVNPDTSVSIAYPDTFYCSTDTNPRAIIIGDSTGVFSSFPQGLVFLNNNNGLIDLASSPAGSYTISYAIQNACLDTSTSFDMTIAALSDPAFDYDRIEYCQSDSDPTPIVADSGGVFTEPTGGITFADNLGTIDLSNSDPGPYLIYYESPGPCPDSDFRQVTVNSNPTIALDVLPGNEICERDSVILTSNGGTTSAVTTFYRFNVLNTFQDSLVGTTYARNDLADGDSVGVTIRELTGCFSAGGTRFNVFKYPAFTYFNAPTTISADRPIDIVVGGDEDSTYFFYSYTTSPPGTMVPEVGVGASNPIQSVGDSTTITERFTLLSDRDPSQVTFLIRAIAKGGCAGDDSTVVININPNNADIFIPEAFTPNGDDINDVWQIQLRGDQDINDFRLDLYNDYGGLVKQMNPVEVNWDGENLPDGVYWWILYKQGVVYLKGGLTIITK